MSVIGERIELAGLGRRIRGERSVADLLRMALLATMDLAFGVLLAWFVSPLLGLAFFALVGAVGACGYREATRPRRPVA
ncbi:MAG TPA: hypothetical protein VFU94_01515 [Conexibacter sp.]|nr:hypothetical protein [Conexibacter sp.]